MEWWQALGAYATGFLVIAPAYAYANSRGWISRWTNHFADYEFGEMPDDEIKSEALFVAAIWPLSLLVLFFGSIGAWLSEWVERSFPDDSKLNLLDKYLICIGRFPLWSWFGRLLDDVIQRAKKDHDAER
jgi:hypothetical protein